MERKFGLERHEKGSRHDNGGGGHSPGGSPRNGHSRQEGRWARLRHRVSHLNPFGHSHDSADSVDDALAASEEGIRALKISLVALMVTALLQAVVVAFSGSVALLADTIHNFGDALTALPLWVAFALARRPANRSYTYGYGRAEDLAGVAIVGLIFFSACVAGYQSAMKLVYGSEVSNVGWVAVAGVVGFLGNELVAQFRIRVGKRIGSAALVADGQHARTDGFTSLAVVVGAIGVWLGYPILDPLVGLGITVAILFIVKDAAKAVFLRLLAGVEPRILAEVERAPMHVEGVQEVHQPRARWLGHKVHADLHVPVDRRLSVAEAHAIVDRVQEALAEHVPS